MSISAPVEFCRIKYNFSKSCQKEVVMNPYILILILLWLAKQSGCLENGWLPFALGFLLCESGLLTKNGTNACNCGCSCC